MTDSSENLADLKNVKESLVLALHSAKNNAQKAKIQSDLSVVNIKIRRARNQEDYDKHQVTDHALVRWLERVHKIDVRKLKDHIFIGIAHKMDGDSFIEKDNFVYVLNGTNVTTVIPNFKP